MEPLGTILKARQVLWATWHVLATGVQVRPKDVKRPKPLYACTAGQLGLHTTRYIPSLLDAMLPPAAHRSSRLYLEDLLLLPPPPDVAASIREACRQLSGELSATYVASIFKVRVPGR